ncbi:MAG: DUF1501 domain-containing protein [Gemmataceae bacterium]|nr:DUF1501 domain-containing protein [Gemmataceae bacterium]
MRCQYACGTNEHGVSRRAFLGGAAGAGLAALTSPLAAKELSSKQKRVLVVWLSGGVSQLETWDPKPGTVTGGPFRAIPTSVPGIYISELLPKTAKWMHKLALVRGINTKEDDHGKGAYIMHTGRRQEPANSFPHLGSVCSKLLTTDANPLPGYLNIVPGGGGQSAADAAYLGPRFGSVGIGEGKAPANLDRPGSINNDLDQQRHMLRQAANERFLARRRSAMTEAYTQTYDQARLLMEKKSLFNIDSEAVPVGDRYGRHDFGRHCLLARRLLEGGATFVKVTHTNYDTHHENFDFHIEQLSEFDKPFSNLLEELDDRGMLESTLIMVKSEFGRTPNINRNYGRDHWSRAWSVALGGCGLKPGAVVGKTNATGTAVVDREVDGGHLFHTYLRALGFDSKRNFYVDQRPMPMADPKGAAIEEILA